MGGLRLSFDEWKERVTANSARDLPEVEPIQWRGRLPPLAICASGPSLKEHLGALKRMVKQGSRLMVVNRAYGFVVRHGMTPDLFAAFDPGEEMVGAVAPRCEHTFHLLASQMHPKVFDALQGRKVALWHAWSRGFEYDRAGEHLLSGDGAVHETWGARHLMCMGSHIGMHALALATFIGHFDIHLFGFDGCLRKGKSHAVKQARDQMPLLEVEYDGRTYSVDPPLANQADEFEKVARIQKDKFSLTFHGHGLLAAIWKKETNGRPQERDDLPRQHPLVQRPVPLEGRTVLV